MSGKRPSLAESMRAVAIPVPTPESQPDPPPATRKAKTPPIAVPVEAQPKAFFAATRAGKKKATVALSPAAHRQLKGLTLDIEGKTMETLMVEAINDLFRKYGKQPIA